MEPRAAAAKAGIKVAGGQTTRSALPANDLAPAMILLNSAAEAASPFIFQLPATSGMILSAAIKKTLLHAVISSALAMPQRRPQAKPCSVARSCFGLYGAVAALTNHAS